MQGPCVRLLSVFGVPLVVSRGTAAAGKEEIVSTLPYPDASKEPKRKTHYVHHPFGRLARRSGYFLIHFPAATTQRESKHKENKFRRKRVYLTTGFTHLLFLGGSCSSSFSPFCVSVIGFARSLRLRGTFAGAFFSCCTRAFPAPAASTRALARFGCGGNCVARLTSVKDDALLDASSPAGSVLVLVDRRFFDGSASSSLLFARTSVGSRARFACIFTRGTSESSESLFSSSCRADGGRVPLSPVLWEWSLHRAGVVPVLFWASFSFCR